MVHCRSVTTILLALAGSVLANNNYKLQAKSRFYEPFEEDDVDNGIEQSALIQKQPPSIKLNNTEAFLNCSSGFMNVDLVFKQPFFGIVYATERNSACKLTGNGKLSETIQLPLKGCGTFQQYRNFTNNIYVRLHPNLEMDGDEVITVICEYPEPIAVPPLAPAELVRPPVETVRTLQPLREFEVLMIICGIIFLSMLLLGMGCSYYCLKKRNIKVVRRRPASTLGSDVTKISEPVSLFGGLKIPRPHAVEALSGSDEQTESVHTDFASDTASVVTEDEYTSAYSDKMCILAEGAVAQRKRAPPLPDFDVRMNVTGAAKWTPAPSVVSGSSGSETMLQAQEQYLTTLLERTETNTRETLERVRKQADAPTGPPPVHARINVKNKVLSDSGTDIESVSEYSRDDTELFSEQELELESRQMRNVSLAGVHRSQAEIDVGSHRQQQQVRVDHDHRSTYLHTIRERQTEENNFDVLIRIIDEPEHWTVEMDDSSSTGSAALFTDDERRAIRTVMLEDSSVQSQLKSTFQIEQAMTVLRSHATVQEAVAPQKWDVLIRILNSADGDTGGFSRRSSTALSLASASTRTGHDNYAYASEDQGTLGRSSVYSATSAADRSATEITEYHYVRRSNHHEEWNEEF